MNTRWVVLQMPWWQCIAAAVPFLMRPGDRYALIAPADYRGPRPDEIDVVMAPHRAPQLAGTFERHADRILLYETENLLGAPGWRRRSEALRRACPGVAWLNYSAVNARVFGDEPWPLRRLLSPVRARPWPTASGGPDVLFVGSPSARRTRVLAQLRVEGLKVCAPTGPVFGSDLAYLEAASRLVLNIHYYTPGIFEAFRVVPAIHRGARVLSEVSEGGEGAEWCECVPYDRLVRRAIEILKESEP